MGEIRTNSIIICGWQEANTTFPTGKNKTFLLKFPLNFVVFSVVCSLSILIFFNPLSEAILKELFCLYHERRKFLEDK